MKLFGRDKGEDNEEKPIVLYYAKYIGVLGSDKSRPVDEDSYVYIFNDRIEIKLLKSKGGILLSSKGEAIITIPYRNMTELQHVDVGKKVDADRVLTLGLAGLLWKRRAIVTVIKYDDDNSEPQTIALDFRANTKYAQPLVDKKFRELHPKLPPKDTSQAVISVANELSKL